MTGSVELQDNAFHYRGFILFLIFLSYIALAFGEWQSATVDTAL
jgi:hypothetical protein